MRNQNPDDFVDQVAQAVIDRMEERNRLADLVEVVIQRVSQMQKEEAALQVLAQSKASPSTAKETLLEETNDGK